MPSLGLTESSSLRRIHDNQAMTEDISTMVPALFTGWLTPEDSDTVTSQNVRLPFARTPAPGHQVATEGLVGALSGAWRALGGI